MAFDWRSIRGDILVCLIFFTRLPLARFGSPDRRLGEAIWAAPIAGLAVALIGALTFAVVDFLGVPSLPAAGITLAAIMLTTGLLHEDGLSDVADGFGGGKTVERKLEIMHDSRLGTYGAAALVVASLIRWSALANLAAHDQMLIGLIAAEVASRSIFARLLIDTPLAAQGGLASTVGAISDRSAWTSLAIGAAALLFLGPFAAFVTALACLVVVVAFRQLCLRQIGGLNGDTLGAAQQLVEITVLVAATVVLA